MLTLIKVRQLDQISWGVVNFKSRAAASLITHWLCVIYFNLASAASAVALNCLSTTQYRSSSSKTGSWQVCYTFCTLWVAVVAVHQSTTCSNDELVHFTLKPSEYFLRNRLHLPAPKSHIGVPRKPPRRNNCKNNTSSKCAPPDGWNNGRPGRCAPVPGVCQLYRGITNKNHLLWKQL